MPLAILRGPTITRWTHCLTENSQAREPPTRPRQDAPTASIRGGTISTLSETRNAEFPKLRLTKSTIPAGDYSLVARSAFERFDT